MKINVWSATESEPACIVRVEDSDNLLSMMNGICLHCSQRNLFSRRDS